MSPRDQLSSGHTSGSVHTGQSPDNSHSLCRGTLISPLCRDGFAVRAIFILVLRSLPSTSARTYFRMLQDIRPDHFYEVVPVCPPEY